MHFTRRFLQFNDLVFDTADMVEEDSYVASLKTFDSEYGFRHGSYAPQKRKGGLFRMGRVSMTITLRLSKIPCEHRRNYVKFAKRELSRQGRLWAVSNDTLIWAYAILTSIREDHNSLVGTVSFDVDFRLPEGIWHKADLLKTFLLPYDPCDFMDCYDFEEFHPCTRFAAGDCCENCKGSTETPFCDCCGEDCDTVTQDMALCYFHDYEALYDECEIIPYRIRYDCAAAEKLFGDPYGRVMMGQRFCSSCGEKAAGLYHSNTDLPTENIKIVLHSQHGTFKNPYIEINGNANIIEGEYEGVLEILPNGEVYNYREGCIKCDPLPASVWKIPPGHEYGWMMESGKNRVIIDGGCCVSYCAYITDDAITF